MAMTIQRIKGLMIQGNSIDFVDDTLKIKSDIIYSSSNNIGLVDQVWQGHFCRLLRKNTLRVC